MKWAKKILAHLLLTLDHHLHLGPDATRHPFLLSATSKWDSHILYREVEKRNESILSRTFSLEVVEVRPRSRIGRIYDFLFYVIFRQWGLCFLT